ncbi:MAG: transposase [Deltaproteobacteria bacterium]
MARSQRQLGFEFRTWGGARKGAGRPPKARAAGVSHLRRPSHSRHHPLHVTLRVQRDVPSLREHSLFVLVRKALAAGKQQFGFSLVHFSVQRDHLHLIAEANERRALSRGVQGLSIRLALAINRHLERKGRLFVDRYHARALKTPREVRFALRYVLLNARKHARDPKGRAGALVQRRVVHARHPKGRAGDRNAPVGALARSCPESCGGHEGVPVGFVDSCSSAAWFRGFDRPEGLAFGAQEVRAQWLRTSGSSDPPVVEPSIWLLRVGQRRAGCFDVDETPNE